MKKKILVIGGAGYIGGSLIDLLNEDNNYIPTVLDNLIYEEHYLKDVNFINHDIIELEKIKNKINDYDVVVFLAALVGDPACAVDKNLTYKINVLPVKWLADNYNGKIIFTSTCSIYGKNDNLLDESATPNPLSVYAETKLEAENYLFNNRPDSLIYRLGTLYGLGDTYSRPRLDLVVNVLTLRASQQEPLHVYGGDQWRPLLHVKDVGEAILYGATKNLNGIFNLSECNETMKGIAESVALEIQTTTIKYSDIPFEDMRNYRVENKKILSTGWKPTLNLKQGIKEIYNMFKNKRIKNINNIIYHNGNYIKKIYGE